MLFDENGFFQLEVALESAKNSLQNQLIKSKI